MQKVWCKMKTKLLIPVMIFGIMFFPIPAHASCSAPPVIGAEFYNFERAHVVFVGTVIDIYNPHPDIHPGTEEYDTITFDVTRVLKGDVGDGTVRTGHDSVGYGKFEIGKSYLVYAFGGIRDVSQCTPPILLSAESVLTLHEAGYYIPFVLIGVIAIVPVVIVWRKRK